MASGIGGGGYRLSVLFPLNHYITLLLCVRFSFEVFAEMIFCVFNTLFDVLFVCRYMVIGLANGSSYVIDFRDQAPSVAYPNMYVGRLSESARGPRAVAIPGNALFLFSSFFEWRGGVLFNR